MNYYICWMEIKTRGGKRPGAGRPKHEPKKPLGKRVPVRFHTHLIEIVNKELSKLMKR